MQINQFIILIIDCEGESSIQYTPFKYVYRNKQNKKQKKRNEKWKIKQEEYSF